MNIYDEKLNALIAFLGTIFTWLFGAWDVALIILITFMLLDYLTGLVRAYISKELSSNTGFTGLARKSVIFIVLILAVSLDRLLNAGTWLFRTLIAYFYIANEGLSILENCVAIGLPFPSQLVDALEQLKQGQKKEKI